MFTATGWWYIQLSIIDFMELNDKTGPHILYAHGKVATVFMSIFSYTHVLIMLFFSPRDNIPDSQ
jgi:hypothetical protein